MATTTDPSGLVAWLGSPSNRCYLNTRAVTVKSAGAGAGVGVFAKATLDPTRPSPHDLDPNVLLRVHKSMALCGKNCTVANVVYEEGLDGIDALVVAVLYEIQQGSASPWYGYLKSINHTAEPGRSIMDLAETGAAGAAAPSLILPAPFWEARDLALLGGTEVEMVDGLDDAQLRYHYAVAIMFSRHAARSGLSVPPLLENCLPPGNEGDAAPEMEADEDASGKPFDEAKFAVFAAFFLAITSRAFDVDNYRDLALVPGADLFNHSVEENVHFVTLGEVCAYCGKDACGHGEYGPPDDSDDSEVSDAEDSHLSDASPAVVESLDGAEHLTELTLDYVAELEQELAEADSDSESETSFDADLDPLVAESYLDPDECCDIVLERRVKKGEELYNTYGDLSSAELLVKYAFALQDNPNDAITLGPQVSAYVGALADAAEEGDSEAKNLLGRLEWYISSGYPQLTQYIQMMQAEDEEEGHDHCDDGCCGDEKGGCEDDQCQDNHCDAGATFDAESNQESEAEPEEYQWMEDCKLGFPGNFNGFAIAVATLLTAPETTFDELREAFADEELLAAPGYAGAFVEKKLILEASKASNSLLKKLVQEKLAAYSDKNKSGDLKRMLKKASGNRLAAYTVLYNEKKMLEAAAKKLK